MEKKEKLKIFVLSQSENCTGKVDHLWGNSDMEEKTCSERSEGTGGMKVFTKRIRFLLRSSICGR